MKLARRGEEKNLINWEKEEVRPETDNTASLHLNEHLNFIHHLQSYTQASTHSTCSCFHFKLDNLQSYFSPASLRRGRGTNKAPRPRLRRWFQPLNTRQYRETNQSRENKEKQNVSLVPVSLFPSFFPYFFPFFSPFFLFLILPAFPFSFLPTFLPFFFLFFLLSFFISFFFLLFFSFFLPSFLPFIIFFLSICISCDFPFHSSFIYQILFSLLFLFINSFLHPLYHYSLSILPLFRFNISLFLMSSCNPSTFSLPYIFNLNFTLFHSLLPYLPSMLYQNFPLFSLPLHHNLLSLSHSSPTLHINFLSLSIFFYFSFASSQSCVNPSHYNFSA